MVMYSIKRKKRGRQKYNKSVQIAVLSLMPCSEFNIC